MESESSTTKLEALMKIKLSVDARMHDLTLCVVVFFGMVIALLLRCRIVASCVASRHPWSLCPFGKVPVEAYRPTEEEVSSTGCEYHSLHSFLRKLFFFVLAFLWKKNRPLNSLRYQSICSTTWQISSSFLLDFPFT